VWKLKAGTDWASPLDFFRESDWLTVDIVSQLDPEDKQTLTEMKLLDGEILKKPVAILPNSNNRGYCRVILQSSDIKHFSEYLSFVETYDRC
jgi:hypothetical protein